MNDAPTKLEAIIIRKLRKQADVEVEKAFELLKRRLDEIATDRFGWQGAPVDYCTKATNEGAEGILRHVAKGVVDRIVEYRSERAIADFIERVDSMVQP